MSRLVILFIVLAAAYALWKWIPRYRLRKAMAEPFPERYRDILQSRIPVYSALPDALQEQLHRLIKQFLFEKDFYGCAGLEIDDEMRLTIAGEACLLLLNRPTRVYPALKTILVYPTTFVAPRIEHTESGVVHQGDSALLGESWSHGRVVLAWDNVQHGARNFTDGKNVVLHEFAHQLDSQSGSTDGAPVLDGHGSYRSWAGVLSQEFAELQRDARRRRRSLMDHYGATNPAEFFAVATETFFEKPERMARHHEELFRELKGFYKVDPRDWR